MSTKNNIVNFILFIFLTSFIRQQENKLPEFEVEFIQGCAGITHYRIKVYSLDNKYYAEHSAPTYFNGTTIDSILKEELDIEQIEACQKFIQKAKTLPKRCQRITSSEFHHIIYIDNDTLDIYGNCEWDNLDFKFLDKALFQKQHNEIEKKKVDFVNSLNQKLIGKWYSQPIKGKLKRDTKVVFNRKKITSEFIEFGTSQKLAGNLKALNAIDLKEFETHTSDGWNETVLTIEWGKILYKNESRVDYYHTATFTLERINNEELVLEFQWSN